MKKILTLLLVLVAATSATNASSYLTFSENDTLRISPNFLGFYVNVPVIANFDSGVADHWRVEITYPTVLEWEAIECTDGNGVNYGINIPYYQSDGTAAVYNAALNVICEEILIGTYAKQTVLESSTTVQGYWDPDGDGNYEPYGLVKWGPGRFDRFFDVHFKVNGDCTGDSIVIHTTMTSTIDWRYPTLFTQHDQVIRIIVAYMRGDVNGDELVNMYDVTALIDYLKGTIDLNQYQFAAADVNHDGNVTIADVTALIDLLLGQGTYNVEDFEDM